MCLYPFKTGMNDDLNRPQAFNNMKKVENVLMRSPLGYYSEFPKNTLTVEEKIQTQTFSSVGFHS